MTTSLIRSYMCTSHYVRRSGAFTSIRSLCDTSIPADGATMQNDVETRVKNLRGFFPWKPTGSSSNHPRRPSIMSILYLKFVEAGRSPPFLNRAEFIPANKVAFQAATDSIFTHPLMRHHKKYVASKNPDCTDIDIKGLDGELPLKMPEIFAPDLAAFYQYAIEQHCLNHTHVCTYSLKDISKVSLTDMQWYMGAPVTANLSTGSPLRGLNIFIVPEAFAATGVTFGTMLNKVFERVDMSKYLLRLSVEIECEEVFAITDAVSGELLQGDLTPRTVVHQVVLENVIVEKDFAQNSGWTIVDIDNWLEGNKYWVGERLLPPRSPRV